MVKLILNDQVLEWSNEDLDDMYVDEGLEGEVFRFNDYACKIYKTFCSKDRLGEEECSKFMEIPSKYFLLPRGPIYDEEHQFMGYYTEFIEKYSESCLWNLTMKELIPMLESAYEELSYLAELGIQVDDLRADNCLYRNGFYFVDLGSYHFEDTSYSRNLSYNRECFSTFITLDLLSRCPGLSIKKKAFLANYFLGVDYFPDVLAEEPKDETIKKYVKRITS